MKQSQSLSDESRSLWLSATADAALQAMVNANTFTRGKTYAASGAVVLSDSKSTAEPPAVSAVVNGTQAYQTALALDDDDALSGECNCENARAGWFCKHQVALALVWRATLDGTPIVVEPAAQKKVAAAAKRAQTVKSNEQALRDFLLAQDAAALAGKLIEMAERDRAVLRELQQWRKITAAQSSPDDLKPLVTEILDTGRNFLDWRESREYCGRAMAVIPVLQRARKQDAQMAVGLTLHALRRCWAVLEQADDSDGDIGGVCEAIGGEWVAAIVAAGEQPAAFAETYLKAMLEDPFGSFASDAVEAAMGVPALMRYRKLLAAAWEQAVAAVVAESGAVKQQSARIRMLRATSPSLTDAYFQMKRLERLHIRQLEASGDHEAVLALLRAAAGAAQGRGEAMRVVNYLEKIGRQREALLEAEKLAKNDPTDWQVQEALLRAYDRDGYVEEALAIRRAQFDAGPTVDRFQAVLKAVTTARRDDAAMREELWNALAERELQQQKQPVSAFTLRYGRGNVERNGGKPARNVSLRAEILCAEKKWLDALALVQPPHVCADTVLAHIAKHLPKSHNEDAITLLKRVFDSMMPPAQTPYKEVLALVSDIASRMVPETRIAWLDGLRAQYRAKRNFIAGLPDGT